MPYLQITIQTTQAEADRMADTLMTLDALSVSLLDASDEPLFQMTPEENPLWTQVNIRALFPDATSPRSVITTLKTALGYTDPIIYKIEKLGDQDWVRLTQQHFQPQCHADRFWVYPSWHDCEDNQAPHIRIDPGLAFGTGTHETTALCLAWLATHDITDQTVIDYGCGSGILSIAALTLGAKQVYATDHDAQAIEATQNNAALNPACNTHNLIVSQPPPNTTIKADVIIANILANPLITLAATLTQHSHPETQLVLSGILNHEITAVTQAYADQWQVVDIADNKEWARVTLTRLLP